MNSQDVAKFKKKQIVDSEQTIGLVLTIAFCFVMLPLLMVVFKEYCGWEFELTGQMEDTIGGLTAPIIGLLNAVLGYVAFRQQITANEMQMKAIIEEQKRFTAGLDFDVLTRILENIQTQTQNAEKLVR
jgi:hypothetical protein